MLSSLYVVSLFPPTLGVTTCGQLFILCFYWGLGFSWGWGAMSGLPFGGGGDGGVSLGCLVCGHRLCGERMTFVSLGVLDVFPEICFYLYASTDLLGCGHPVGHLLELVLI